MLDRRSQRIRENFRQQANPRARSTTPPSLAEQLRRVYAGDAASRPNAPDGHAELARRLSRRRGRR